MFGHVFQRPDSVSASDLTRVIHCLVIDPCDMVALALSGGKRMLAYVRSPMTGRGRSCKTLSG
jgi:hypothetical protein